MDSVYGNQSRKDKYFGMNCEHHVTWLSITGMCMNFKATELVRILLVSEASALNPPIVPDHDY